MERGILRAFEKRPVPKDKIDKMINEIESQIRKKGVKEIKSSTIGELIMKKIKKLDNVAYIRFASVYRNFQDIEDFKKQLKEL
jgi:transcriptional repressor NrdR